MQRQTSDDNTSESNTSFQPFSAHELGAVGAQASKRSVGVQTEVPQRDLVPPRVLSLTPADEDNYPKILYKSRTITGLVILIGGIYWASRQWSYDLDAAAAYSDKPYLYHAHLGFKAAMFAFVIYGMIYLPNTYMNRPHPAVWRILHALGLCYVAMLCCANMFPRDQLQIFLREAVDSQLGRPLKEKSYAEDCRVYTPEHPESAFYNITSSIDVFFVAHAIGWMVKMLVIRDFKLCMIQSILFEFLEITFRHWLPNFWECWWDHIIFDLIVCNTGGIIIGWYLIKFLGMKEYRWSLKDTSKPATSWFYNFRQLFNPRLEEHQWRVFSSTKRFLQVVFYIFMSQLIDLNYFFNKFVLNLEPRQTFCTFRTFMIGFLAIPASREYYEFISNKHVKRMGPYAWNVFAIIGLEVLLFWNNMDPQKFTKPFPWYVVVSWQIIGAFIVIVLCGLLYRDLQRMRKRRAQKKHN